MEIFFSGSDTMKKQYLEGKEQNTEHKMEKNSSVPNRKLTTESKLTKQKPN